MDTQLQKADGISVFFCSLDIHVYVYPFILTIMAYDSPAYYSNYGMMISFLAYKMFNPSHAVRDLSRVRQYPLWLLFTAFVDSMGYPRYNPQKTRKQ